MTPEVDETETGRFFLHRILKGKLNILQAQFVERDQYRIFVFDGVCVLVRFENIQVRVPCFRSKDKDGTVCYVYRAYNDALAQEGCQPYVDVNLFCTKKIFIVLRIMRSPEVNIMQGNGQTWKFIPKTKRNSAKVDITVNVFAEFLIDGRRNIGLVIIGGPQYCSRQEKQDCQGQAQPFKQAPHL